MKQKSWFFEQVDRWEENLERSELSAQSVKKYTNDVKRFLCKCDDDITFEAVQKCRQTFFDEYMPSSANSMIQSVNRFMRWIGNDEYVMKLRKIQAVYDDDIISFNDYKTMVEFTRLTGRKKMYCIIRSLASTGMRISELKFVTVESVQQGSIQVYNKGKTRKIYLTETVSALIKKYCEEEGILNGVVFSGRYDGVPISPSAVWQNLQKIASLCEVDSCAINPENDYRIGRGQIVLK